MKTSNYIITAFLIFIGLVLISWHVDSSLHEEEFDRKRNITDAYWFSTSNLVKNQNSLENRHDFAEKAKAYFEYNNISHYDYWWAAHVLNRNFKTFKDTSNLVLAKEWAKIAHEKKPNDRETNFVNGSILEHLGLKEEAKAYFDAVKKRDSINGFKLVEYKNDKGEIERVRQPIDTTTFYYEYEEYRNEAGELIKIKKPIN